MKKIISLVLCFTLICGIPFTASAAKDTQLAQTLAEDLKQLTLFMGVSDTNFDLERAPTRVEALVMLIRVLGAEKQAVEGTWTHPFTDVPAWADKYVGYGYANGLANGISATSFGTGRANAAMYLTFVLRSLGYSEKNDNFTWDKPFDIAKSVGILPAQVDTANFLRADVVLVSYAALNVKLKGLSKTLAEKLIDAGVFTKTAFEANYDANALAIVDDGSLSSEEVYKKCSSAVFYIEIFDASGKATASGSGFFISADGIAVTNYHVIDGAASAKITLSDTKKTYNVKGVLNYSEEEDWAVIKIDGTNFPYMQIGAADTIVGGAEIFAIGSPLGLQNTISQGIISNVSRVIDGNTYIQITAAISHGSSGGALINKYGEVIGITTGSIEAGQSLNLAVPVSKIKNYKGVAVKTFASLFGTQNTPTQPSQPSGSGSSTGARVVANSGYEALYKIATEQKNFDYGDYVGWKGRDGDEATIDIIYSKEHDVICIQYSFINENFTFVSFIGFFPEEPYDVHNFTLKVDGQDKFKSEGTIERSKMKDGYICPVQSAKKVKGFFDDDMIYDLQTEIQSTTAWLALDLLNSSMQMMTNGVWGIEDLGYVNLYK